MKTNRSWFAVALLVLVTCLALGWQQKTPASAEVNGSDEPLATPIPVNVVSAGSVLPNRVERSFAGILIPRRESQLSFQTAGRVVEIVHEEGDRIAKGDLLARLSVERLDAMQVRSEAELAAASARLEELIAGPRPQTVLAARANVGQLNARLSLASANKKREQQLAVRSAGSRRALDESIFGEEEISQQLRSAQAELALLEEGTRQEQIDAQRAVCDSIRGQLREIESNRRDCRIEAPFDGIVRTRFVDEGVGVKEGEPILHLISNEIEGQFGIPADIAEKIDPRKKLEVGLRTHRCTGEVVRMEPGVDRATRTRAIYVRLCATDDHISDRWVPGEVVQVHLADIDDSMASEEGSPRSFWLPTTALARGGHGIWTILVVPGNDSVARCERRAAEWLKTEGDHSLVQGMLEHGDRVIVDGMHRITAGMEVRAIRVGETSETSR